MSYHWLRRSSGLLQQLTAMAAFVQSRMSFSNQLTTKNTAEQKVNEMQLGCFSFGRYHYIFLTWMSSLSFQQLVAPSDWCTTKVRAFKFTRHTWCMWVLFGSFVMFSNIYRFYFYKKTHVGISKSTMKYLKKWIEIWTSPNVLWLLGVHVCRFLN
jgi:hypothetical protein